jgi:hypothetical protein
MQVLRSSARSTGFEPERKNNMRQFLTLLALATGCCSLALAESWSGMLLDASCYDQQKSAQPCAATNSTTTFMIDVSGTVYALDSAGNSKAADAMKSRADRSTNPNGANGTPVTAKVTGRLQRNIIAVETIDVQ